MKAILAPTDFSKHSKNAVLYAAELAKLSKAELILIHIYDVPILSGDSTVILPVWDDLEKNYMDALDEQKFKLYKKVGSDLNITCVTKMGFSIEDILKEYITFRKVDLVVMGMQGAGFLREKIVGSVTTSFIKGSDCPVLVINEKVKFRNPEKIVLAYDYENKVSISSLYPLKEFIKLFHSQIFVLTVITKNQSIPSTTEVEETGLKSFMDETTHSFHYVNSEDIIDGINKFIKSKKANMAVVVSRKHSFFSNLFRGNNTSKMAFRTSTPLLVLHGGELG